MNCNNKYCPGVHDFYIRPTDAAMYLDVSLAKLEIMRNSREGPTCIQYDTKAVMYSGESVKRFATKLPKKTIPKVEPLDIF